MRILHTSDWHLGAKLQQVDLAEEHALFLAWLREQLVEHDVDVLVIAGDVFHYAQPSNAAQSMYYGFLAACGDIASLKRIVVVAGNHDSPTGIDAPGQVLSALNVHVVGALPRDLEARGQCLVPVPGGTGEIELVIAAVPYVQEAMLGIELGDRTEAKLQTAYAEAFHRLYRDLAEEAALKHPGAAIVATGHLTAYGKADGEGPKNGDYHTPLHRTSELRDAEANVEQSADDETERPERLSIGTLDALSPDIFDTRYAYVALGHIHRPMPVGGKRHIRYSGTPVATDRTESTPQRQVVLVDVDGHAEAAITIVPVPTWRDLVVLKDTPEAVCDALLTLTSDAELAPAVFVDVLLGPDDARGRNWNSELHALIDGRPVGSTRPQLVEVREIATTTRTKQEASVMPPLEQLTPEDVFRAMYRRKNESEEGIDTLLPAFRELIQSVVDEDGGDA